MVLGDVVVDPRDTLGLFGVADPTAALREVEQDADDCRADLLRRELQEPDGSREHPGRVGEREVLEYALELRVVRLRPSRHLVCEVLHAGSDVRPVRLRALLVRFDQRWPQHAVIALHALGDVVHHLLRGLALGHER